MNDLLFWRQGFIELFHESRGAHYAYSISQRVAVTFAAGGKTLGSLS